MVFTWLLWEKDSSNPSSKASSQQRNENQGFFHTKLASTLRHECKQQFMSFKISWEARLYGMCVYEQFWLPFRTPDFSRATSVPPIWQRHLKVHHL
jgi:hypothetical protein